MTQEKLLKNVVFENKEITQKTLENRVKLLRGGYVSTVVNFAVSLDITLLGNHGFLLLAVDLVTRGVITYGINEKRIDSGLSTNLIEFLIRAKKDRNPIKIIHRDKDAVLSTNSFKKILKDYDFKVFIAISLAFQNQVSERLNKTVRDILCTLSYLTYLIKSSKFTKKSFYPLYQKEGTIPNLIFQV